MSKRVITPELAKKYLENNTNNRKLSNNIVNRYSEEMKKDNWKYNGQSIKISKDNTILDGQHRLHACVLSGVNFETEFISGLDNSVFDTIDTGRNRSLSDSLYIKGFKNSVVFSAILKDVYCYKVYNYAYGCKKEYLSNHDALLFLETEFRLKELITKSIDATMTLSKVKPILVTQSKLAFLFYLLNTAPLQGAKEDSIVFLDGLVHGNNLSKDSSILSLRQILLKNRIEFDNRLDSCYSVIDLCLQAWNMTRCQRRISKLNKLVIKPIAKLNKIIIPV